MADSHEKIAALYRKRAADPRESARFNNEQAVIFARAARNERAKAKRAADRGSDYRRAALNPWLPIVPDEADSAGFRPPDRDRRTSIAKTQIMQILLLISSPIESVKPLVSDQNTRTIHV